MTQKEVNKRFDEIHARGTVELTPEEETSLMAAEALDDGSLINLDELKEELNGYNGRVLVRMPRSLQKRLKEAAALEGVSLNQYIVYKLA